uniref:G_PROTEIN_RECEP_F1_2 domain-containing protein n=1 Tax=Steinernema glaseri TaxID=37863 RepID=A0A1I7YZC3_9BILA
MGISRLRALITAVTIVGCFMKWPTLVDALSINLKLSRLAIPTEWAFVFVLWESHPLWTVLLYHKVSWESSSVLRRDSNSRCRALISSRPCVFPLRATWFQNFCAVRDNCAAHFALRICFMMNTMKTEADEVPLHQNPLDSSKALPDAIVELLAKQAMIWPTMSTNQLLQQTAAATLMQQLLPANLLTHESLRRIVNIPASISMPVASSVAASRETSNMGKKRGSASPDHYSDDDSAAKRSRHSAETVNPSTSHSGTSSLLIELNNQNPRNREKMLRCKWRPMISPLPQARTGLRMLDLVPDDFAPWM